MQAYPPAMAAEAPSAPAGAGICASVANDERLVLMGLLFETSARLQRSLGAALELDADMPLSWFEVLIRLARSPEGRLTMSEVANQTVYTTGGTTRLIDRIEEAGLLERASCPSDRRATYVVMTKAGEEALQRATARHLEHIDVQMWSQLSDEERTTLISALARLNGGSPACAG